MKKYIFLITTILLSISMTMAAQNNRRFGRRGMNYNNSRREYVRFTPKERVDLMTKELDLTKEQADKVLELMEKQEATRQEQVEAHRAQRLTDQRDRANRRAEMQTLRAKEVEEHFAELEKIIGKEKVEKWNELRKETREANRSWRNSNRAKQLNNSPVTN